MTQISHDGDRPRVFEADDREGPRASMRARSYHASPGPAKASVLCIILWMI